MKNLKLCCFGTYFYFISCIVMMVLYLTFLPTAANAADDEGHKQLVTALNQFDQTKNTGTMYRHPTGITFWYPSDWQIQMLSGIVQLLPNGTDNTPEHFESYFITAENTAQYGISDPDHPEIMVYLQEQMGALSQHLGVFFKQNNKNRIATRQGNGIRVDWTAQSNYGPVAARTYVSILNGYGLVFAAVGVGDRLTKRDSEINQIFSSLSVGQGSIDHLLIGTWVLSSTKSLQNNSVWISSYDQAKYASETTSTLTFSQDGSWQRVTKTQALMGAGSLWLENNSTKSSKGNWNADQGQLFMVWEDQSFADYRYQVNQNRLYIENSKIKQVWTRSR